MKTILTNCTIIDCTGKPPLKDFSVVIESDRVVGLIPGGYQEKLDGEERVIDLDGGYILPGLWSAHSHLGDVIPSAGHILETESPIDYTIRAGRNAIDAIQAGITGIRVVGEGYYADVAWREAFDAGLFVGPHLFVCGQFFLATGGFGHLWPGAVQVDGPHEMRKAVRDNIQHGVDQIKIYVTGDVMQDPQLMLDEIRAATEVAHNRGIKVCAHAWNTLGVKMAIQGGVDCIEHGLLDDESIEMMLEHDLFYVPTLLCTNDIEIMQMDRMPKSMILKAKGAELHLTGFQKAMNAGIKIACGGDYSPVSFFTLLELEHLVRAGMGEMEALIATTRTTADLCGVGDQLGTVEVGKIADLIVLSANPLEEISNIRKLEMVLKDGRLVDISPQEGLVDLWELFN